QGLPDGSGDGDPEQDQRRRIIDQALALEDRHDPPRQPDPPGDRGGGDRVRRRDHRAERERGGQRYPRHQQVDGEPDATGGEQHEPDREEEDRAQVVTERGHRRLDRRHVQQRWQYPDQYDLGLQTQLRDRRERQEETGHDEQYWGEQPQPASQRGDRHHDGHQPHRDQHVRHQ